MSEVTSYYLTGDWRHIIDDGLVDPDALPDEALPTGHVEFIPVAPQVAVSGSPETAYTVSSFKALIAAGVLTDLQGREGVQIAGKIGEHPILWRAITHLEYREQEVDYPTIEFTLAADARLTSILASEIAGEPATIYHPRIEELITEVEGKADIGHLHQITDVEGLQSALEAAANTGDGGSGTTGPVSWTEVSGKPTTFPPATHNHPWAEISSKPATFTPSAHSHSISDVTGLSTSLSSKVDTSDPRLTNARTPTAHNHVIGDTTGLQSALDAKVASTDPRLSDPRTPLAHTHPWIDVTSKPTEFPPEEHAHVIADVTGLQAALDAATASGTTISWVNVTDKPTTFAPTAHNHTVSDVDGLQEAIEAASAGLTVGSVQTVYLADDAVTSAKLAGLAVQSEHIAAGAVSSTHIQAGEVKQDNLADGAVSRAKLMYTVRNELDVLRTDVDSKLSGAHTHEVTDIVAQGIPGPNTFLRGDGTWEVPSASAYQTMLQGTADTGTSYTGYLVSPAVLKGSIWHRVTGSSTTPVSTLGQDLNKAADAAAARNLLGAVSDTDSRLTDARTPTAHSHSWAEITSKPTTFTPSAHTHVISEVSDLQTALDSKAPTSHTHTTAQVTGLDTALAGKAAAIHTHSTAQVTGLDAALTGKVTNLGGITGAISITRAAYNALVTKDPTVLYAIREA